LNLKWELLQYDTLAGSYFDFCASGICWLGFPDTGSFPEITAGRSGWAGVHFWTGNIPVTCTAKIRIYNENTPEFGDTLTYILHNETVNKIEKQVDLKNVISIYPNPTKDNLNINFKQINYLHDATILIYDITGKLMLQQSVQQQHYQYDIRKFPNGLYIVRIECYENNIVQMFMKQ